MYIILSLTVNVSDSVCTGDLHRQHYTSCHLRIQQLADSITSHDDDAGDGGQHAADGSWSS